MFSVPAFGHTTLITTSPEGNSTVQSLPERISLDFDEELIDLGSGYELVVIDPDGLEITTGEISINVANISRALEPRTTTGKYKVSYRVVSNDGHVVKGDYTFTLDVPQANPQEKSSEASISAPEPNQSPTAIQNLADSQSSAPEAVAVVHQEHEESFLVHHRTHIIWTIIALIIPLMLWFYKRTFNRD